MARRLGSTRMSKTDCTLCIYPRWHIRVKVYIKNYGGTTPLKPKAGLNGSTEILTCGGWGLWFAVGSFGDVRGDLLEDEFAY